MDANGTRSPRERARHLAQPAVVDAAPEAPLDPQYVPSGRASEVWAHFRSGAVIQASRDRSRHYPGLGGIAPNTTQLYLRIHELGIAASHVLDCGCGAGEGLRHLHVGYRRVSGIDRDARALAFARELTPDVALFQTDLESPAVRIQPAQLAVVVDLLGLLDRPELALMHIGRLLERNRTLFVAEPAGTSDQPLIAPARRAFSDRSLHSLLIRGGFCVEQWQQASHGFIVAQATPCRDPAAQTLLAAEAHLQRGELASAENLARHSCRTSLMPLRLEGLLVLMRVQLAMSHRDAAAATLLEARGIDPTDARPLAALARLAQLAGSESKAFAFAREAVRLDPSEVAGLAALGLLSHESDPKGALAIWLQAHAVAPDHTGIAVHLCDCALRLGDRALAITVLERLRQYSRRSSGVTGSLTMAWLLVGAGQPLQARVEARLAEALAPNSQDVREITAFLRTMN